MIKLAKGSFETDETFSISYLDPSGFSKFSRCPAAYMFSRLMGLILPDASRIALDFGTCLHLAVPYCYDAETLDEGCEVFRDAWFSFGYGEDDPKRNTMRGIDTLKNFHQHRCPGKCPYTIQSFPNIESPEGCHRVNDNEIPFLIDVGAVFPMAGRMDFAAKWMIDSKIYAADYKSTSEISGRWQTSFWNSPQTLAYTLAMAHILGETPPGMIVEGLRVSPRNDEVTMFTSDVHPHMLESFIVEFMAAANTIKWMNENHIWPKKCSGCQPYAMFGQPGYQCEYNLICSSSHPESIVTLYQREEPYHPFKMYDRVIKKGA